MRPLSASDVLRVWEEGESQHPVDRALTLLSAGSPGVGIDALARLPLGERDARLLTLRALTFGPSIAGYAECPRCGERLEFNTATEALRVSPGLDADGPLELIDGDRVIRFRLPDSRDLAAAARCKDPDVGRRQLLLRCVLEVCAADDTREEEGAREQDATHHEGGGREEGAREQDPTRDEGGESSPGEVKRAPVTAWPPGDLLSDEAMGRLSARMAECDPQAEMLLNLECPACTYGWQVLFDIAAFFWTELARHARRVLSEVHTLARVYGWSEAEILAMSDRRRRLYLEMVGA